MHIPQLKAAALVLLHFDMDYSLRDSDFGTDGILAEAVVAVAVHTALRSALAVGSHRMRTGSFAAAETIGAAVVAAGTVLPGNTTLCPGSLAVNAMLQYVSSRLNYSITYVLCGLVQYCRPASRCALLRARHESPFHPHCCQSLFRLC